MGCKFVLHPSFFKSVIEMARVNKKINMYELLLPAGLLICTVLMGGYNWYNCVIPILLFLVYLVKERKNILKNINIVFPFALLITGFIAVIQTQGDKQNALYEYERILCFIAAFFVGLSIKSEYKIFKYMVVCAAVTGICGLLSYCNIIRIEDFSFNDRYVLRLQSFLKYANTTAVLLGCGYFASIKLIDVYNKRVLTYISSCILIAFYLTVSKAAIPLFMVLGTFLFLVQRKHSRYFILQNLVCMVFTLLILLVGCQQQTATFMLILACIVISVSIVHNDKMKQVFTEKRLIVLWFLGFGIFLFMGCLVLISKDINIFETLFKRFDYMKDALILLKEHWLTGIGPGAWKYYQYSIQTTQYNVTDIHNSWMQIWLEFGILFFLAISAIIVKSALYFARKKMHVYYVLVLFIVMHSLVDINLSFGIILMILGLVTGFALNKGNEIRAGKHILYGTLLLCFVIFGYMTCEYAVRGMLENSYLQKKNEQAAKYAEILEKICPYDSNLQISIAALTQENTEQRIKRAIELSPLDPDLVQTDIEYSISHKDKTVLKKIEKYVVMAKYQEITYAQAKEYLVQAFDTGLCTQKEYDECLSGIENLQDELGITDRNELLGEVAEQMKGVNPNEINKKP